MRIGTSSHGLQRTCQKRKAIGEEIARLLAAGFIMEVFYPD
jgi:hypothetical protein